MKNDDEKKKPSLVEKHALDRLDEVEKDKRKAYTKHDDNHSWQTIVVIIIFAIIVAMMLFSMKF